MTPTIAMYEAFLPGTGDRLGKIVADLHRAGASLAAGTDAPFVPYGQGLIDELMLYHASGVSAADTLSIATLGGAKLAGLSGQIGRVEAGYSADIVVVRGDPLQRLESIRDVAWVMSAGRSVAFGEAD